MPQPLALLALTEAGRAMPRHEVEAELRDLLRQLNGQLASHEQLACLVVCSEVWAHDNEAITATLLLRRGVVRARYHDRLGDWLGSGTDIVWES